VSAHSAPSVYTKAHHHFELLALHCHGTRRTYCSFEDGFLDETTFDSSLMMFILNTKAFIRLQIDSSRFLL